MGKEAVGKEGDVGQAGGSGAAEQVPLLGGSWGKVRTRSNLEVLINESSQPLVIKRELLGLDEQDEERMDTSGGREGEDPDYDNGDVVMVEEVVIARGGEGTNSDSGTEDDEDYEDIEEEEEEPEPIESLARLFKEGEKALVKIQLLGKKYPLQEKTTVHNVSREDDSISEDAEEASIPKVDNRYYTVRNLRNKKGAGRELNDAAAQDTGTGTGNGFVNRGDCRLNRNSNTFSVDMLKNVSRSFDANSMRCVTCLKGGHDVMTGKDGGPVVFALGDQHMSPNLPTQDGGECIRILRMEESSLRELTSEFIRVVDRRRLVPGSVILLGSLSQLMVDGTATYAEDWHGCRKQLRNTLGDIMILPLVPIVVDDIKEPACVRSLIEFFSWFQDMPEAEVRLLKETREFYVQSYLAKAGGGAGWADARQNFRMPVSLTGVGKSTYVSRNWGDRPVTIKRFDSNSERVMVDRLIADLNKDLHMNLSTKILLCRKDTDWDKLELETHQIEMVVSGASNAERLAAALTGKGVKVTCLAKPTWRLTGGTAAELAEGLDSVEEDKVLILYGLDNSAFVGVEKSMRSGPPRKGKDGKFHLKGKVAVASGLQMDQMLKDVETVLGGCKNRQVIILTPMPRYWIACCEKHRETYSEEEKEKLLKDLGKFRRQIISIAMRLRISKQVHVVNPLEMLGVRDSPTGIMQLMSDSVHMEDDCYDMLAEEMKKLVAGWKACKRRAERSSEPASKRARLDSGRGRGGGGMNRGRRGGFYNW